MLLWADVMVKDGLVYSELPIAVPLNGVWKLSFLHSSSAFLPMLPVLSVSSLTADIVCFANVSATMTQFGFNDINWNAVPYGITDNFCHRLQSVRTHQPGWWHGPLGIQTSHPSSRNVNFKSASFIFRHFADLHCHIIYRKNITWCLTSFSAMTLLVGSSDL